MRKGSNMLMNQSVIFILAILILAVSLTIIIPRMGESFQVATSVPSDLARLLDLADVNTGS